MKLNTLSWSMWRRSLISLSVLLASILLSNAFPIFFIATPSSVSEFVAQLHRHNNKINLFLKIRKINIIRKNRMREKVWTKRRRKHHDQRVEEGECIWSRLRKCCLIRCIVRIFHRELEFLCLLYSQIQCCFPFLLIILLLLTLGDKSEAFFFFFGVSLFV